MRPVVVQRLVLGLVLVPVVALLAGCARGAPVSYEVRTAAVDGAIPPDAQQRFEAAQIALLLKVDEGQALKFDVRRLGPGRERSLCARFEDQADGTLALEHAMHLAEGIPGLTVRTVDACP